MMTDTTAAITGTRFAAGAGFAARTIIIIAPLP